jgi:hypothetical protein
MFRDEKNLKDSQKDALPNNTDITLKDNSAYLSYAKTDKLITALYMVTDIVDKEEPLRNKLRTLGAAILSDTHSTPHKAPSRIAEVMSFLSIARALNIISSMNCDILEKEFYALDRSIKESISEVKILKTRIDLTEFFKEELEAPKPFAPLAGPARLGVQKGSTLMKALSDRKLASGEAAPSLKNSGASKGQRRQDILNIIKINGGSATIKDIKDKISNMSDKNNSLVSLGEKTLQRELISMIEDGVLYKEGSKRWSRYFVKT